jgi:hypothetical protein
MLKIAGFAAAVVLLVLSSVPSRADCPDSYCPNGTILPGTRAAHEAEQRERRAQCEANCNRACGPNARLCWICKQDCRR